MNKTNFLFQYCGWLVTGKIFQRLCVTTQMSTDEPGCLIHFLPPWPFWMLALHSELSSPHLQNHIVICKASTPGSQELVHVGSCRASVYVSQHCALRAINLSFPKLSAVWCLEVTVILDHKFHIPVVFLHWRWCSVPSSLLQEIVVVSFYYLRIVEKPLAETLRELLGFLWDVTTSEHCASLQFVLLSSHQNKVFLLTPSFPLGIALSWKILLQGHDSSKGTLPLYNSFDTNERGRFNCQIKVECINPHNRSNEVRGEAVKSGSQLMDEPLTPLRHNGT